MAKTRIVEIDDGSYMPQFKSGFFSTWKFFRPDADTGWSMLVRFIQERDPAKAARFQTLAEAQTFLDRFWSNVNQYWQEQSARPGSVRIKRVVH